MEEDRKTETSSGVISSSATGSASGTDVNIGDWVDCVVEQIMPYGAFVRMTESGRKGMIHISELSFNFVKKVEDVLSPHQNVRAKIIKIDDKGRIDLSLKKSMNANMKMNMNIKNDERQPVYHAQGDDFEKKMASFLKTSEAKIADLNSKSAPRSGRKRGGGRQGKN